MAQEGTEEPTRTLLSAQLPPLLYARIAELQRQKGELMAQATALETIQQALLAGYFEGANLGPFNPPDWEISPQGVMTLIDPPIKLFASDGEPDDLTPAPD